MGDKSYIKILVSSVIAIVAFIFMVFHFANPNIFLVELVLLELFIIYGIYVSFAVFWETKEAPMVSYVFFALFLVNALAVFFNSNPSIWFLVIIGATLYGMTKSLDLFDEVIKKYSGIPTREKIKRKYEQIASELKDISVDKPQIIVEKRGSEERIDPEELFARIKQRAEEIKSISKTIGASKTTARNKKKTSVKKRTAKKSKSKPKKSTQKKISKKVKSKPKKKSVSKSTKKKSSKKR